MYFVVIEVIAITLPSLHERHTRVRWLLIFQGCPT